MRGVHHFRVEHGGVDAALLVHGNRARGVLGGRDDLEAFRQARDAVAMAHPHGIALADFPHAVVKRAGLVDGDLGAAEFGGVAAFHRTAELHGSSLLAIADGEDRHAGIERRLRGARRVLVQHRCRAAGKDNADRLDPFERLGRALERHDLGIHPLLANPAGDELSHLAAEVDDEDGVVGGVGRRNFCHGGLLMAVSVQVHTRGED